MTDEEILDAMFDRLKAVTGSDAVVARDGVAVFSAWARFKSSLEEARRRSSARRGRNR